MASEVELDPRLDERVVFYRPGVDAQKVFLEHKLLIVDGVEWDCDMAVLRAGLVRKKRAFKQKFWTTISPEVMAERMRIDAHADRLFAEMFPGFVAVDKNSSWRPMITGPEPLHYDTFPGDEPHVVSFTNVSATPRVYRVGESFDQLCARDRPLLKSIHGNGSIDDLSWKIRGLTMQDKPPLDNNSPRHTVKFAPGSIWFFNAKTVSHEVVYGEGASARSWMVPTCGAETQRSLLQQ